MANTTNYNWETPDDTDLVKDGAAAIRTLGSSVDTTTKALNPSTTLGDIEYRSATANTNTRLPIGTTGQILSVVAGVPSWVANDVGDITEVQAGTGISVASGTGPVPVITNTVATAIDAKGDLVVGTGADTFSRLAVGTNNYVLTADSAEATGLKWAAAAGGGGKVLQVVSASTTTKTTITSTSYTDITNLTATITPSAATSKILVLITANALTTGTSTTFVASSAQIVRGATAIMIQQSVQSSDGASATDLTNGNMVALTYLDSPSTTSATTYKLQAKKRNGVNVIYNWDSGADTNNSTITLMEIGA
jgi:hypothetical protein